MATNARRLWDAYSRARDPMAREKLILKYAGLVKSAAARISLSLPPQAEFDDLVSYGVLGLIEAIDRFRPERGVAFEAYAALRVRGAILDGLRKMDWLSTGVRRRAKEFLKAYASLEQELGRSPTDEEMATKLNVTAKELANRTREAALAIQCPLDGSELPPDRESPEGGPSPEAEVEKAERRRLVAEGIAALPEKEKLVISLIYQENLTGREVASVLGVSPSRVSQLHSRALVRLRAHLDGAEER